MVTRTFNYIYKLVFVWMMAMMMTGCEDHLLPDNPMPEEEQYKGEKVMMAAGTTENSVSTRADGKTYYMPADHRFVCKMYYKTSESGALYDTLRYHTAWLKVDNGGAGNSLYWKKAYPADAQHLDSYGNDEFAPTFYWQNRKEHAFLAWTDLNHATTYTGTKLQFKDGVSDVYEHHTGIKEAQWVEKNFMVNNLLTPFTSLSALREAAMNPTGTSLEALTSDEAQADQQSFAAGIGELPRTEKWYMITEDGVPCINGTINRPNGYHQEGSYTLIDDTHRKSSWYKLTIYDTAIREPYTDDTSNQRTYTYGVYVVDNDGKMVAFQDPNVPTLFYKCDEYGFVICPTEKFVCCYQVYETKESKEIIDEYPAMDFDLSKGSKTKMSQQPDVLQALTIDQVPKSAIMEANRVHLFFKHQFAQVQVNLKNSVDNSVQITEEQIQKVELLGVTNTGYMFTSLKSDGTIDVPAGFKSSTFKEVVATDFTDAQLEANPYGTSFDMFVRDVPNDEKELNKIVKSYECITFGRMQAIRITWKEEDTTDAGGNPVPGVEHVATYRVPEKNDQNQPLRLLEQGTKYIWNIELRRGTLAVVRTEIIPWEENQEEYNADGSIVTTSSNP